MQGQSLNLSENLFYPSNFSWVLTLQYTMNNHVLLQLQNSLKSHLKEAAFSVNEYHDTMLAKLFCG